MQDGNWVVSLMPNGVESSSRRRPSLHDSTYQPSSRPYALANSSEMRCRTDFADRGLWFRRGRTPSMWHPNIELGGVTVSWFKGPNLLKIIRREVVESLLRNHCGSR